MDLYGSNADKRGYTLDDFGTTSILPLPKFDGSTTSLSFAITKCSLTQTSTDLTQTSQNIFYFALFLKDNLDEENKSNFATSSITLPEDLCNPGESTSTQYHGVISVLGQQGKFFFQKFILKKEAQLENS
jgi:hypothetical protein